MKLKICLMGLLCLYFSASARQLPADIEALKVGDIVPDIRISNIIKYSSPSVKISDFKSKVLILDFWATWCTNCVDGFAKSYQVQRELADKMQILLVNCKSTRDSPQRIKDFFAKRKAYYSFPCIVMDTILKKMFPHQTIPHLVWIKDNKVVAITDETQLNTSNVLTALNDNSTAIREKQFIKFDFDKSLFLDAKGSVREDILFNSLLMPYQYGLQGFVGVLIDSVGLVSRIDVLNSSRIGLLRYALPQIAGLNKDRILLRVKNPADYAPDSISEEWKKRNCFSYEAYFPKRSRSAAMILMQSDLEKYFEVRLSSVDSVVDCLVLEVSDSTKIKRNVSQNVRPETNISEHTGGDVYFLNYSVDEILFRFEDIYNVPFVNQTNCQTRINMFLSSHFKNEKYLAADLEKQGFRLTWKKMPVRFFVISQNDGSAIN